MRNVFVVVMVCLLLVSVAPAQDQNQKMAMLKEFTRSVQLDGITLSFVLLNDRTVDALFEAPGKYSMRARARMATTFYVQGTPDKDIKIDTKFTVEQDGETVAGTASNIKNFTDGGAVAKGARIDGILELGKKIDVSHAFKIKNGHSSVDFKLSSDALKLMQPIPNPAAAPAAPPN